jgi:hypothetical protein
MRQQEFMQKLRQIVMGCGPVGLPLRIEFQIAKLV